MFNSHLWVPSMEMQRWSTRWKTRRWPWDSAVTVLITFAFLLRTAEVRGGKKAKGSPVASLPSSGKGPRARLRPRSRGNLSELLSVPGRRERSRGRLRAQRPAGSPRQRGMGRPFQVPRRDGSRSASALNFGCGFNEVQEMPWRGGKMKEILVEQSDLSSSSTGLLFCGVCVQLCFVELLKFTRL